MDMQLLIPSRLDFKKYSLVIIEKFVLMEEKWKIELLILHLNEIENRKKLKKAL
jgi:hypothetical protein